VLDLLAYPAVTLDRKTMGRITGWVGLVGGVLALAPFQGVAQEAALEEPRFVAAWIGGPLDSIYNAEYARLSDACAGGDASCPAAELDTSAVRLAAVWDTPTAETPSGWLVAQLRARGQYVHAAVLFQGVDGAEVELLADLGDWGYGTTLALRDVREDRVRPWLLEAAGGGWLSLGGDRGFGVVEGPHGLSGRLWRLGPVSGERLNPGTEAPSGVYEEMPAGVYMVLEVEEGLVRLRPEVPADMDCGDVPEDAPDASSVPVYAVPLGRLLDTEGRPAVEVAYGRGC
jgi:hypothetical protein